MLTDMPTADAHSVGVRSRCWPLAANNRAESVTLYSQREIRINGNPNRNTPIVPLRSSPKSPSLSKFDNRFFRCACICPYTINASSMLCFASTSRSDHLSGIGVPTLQPRPIVLARVNAVPVDGRVAEQDAYLLTFRGRVAFATCTDVENSSVSGESHVGADTLPLASAPTRPSLFGTGVFDAAADNESVQL
jgi:hypothetical protein